MSFSVFTKGNKRLRLISEQEKAELSEASEIQSSGSETEYEGSETETSLASAKRKIEALKWKLQVRREKDKKKKEAKELMERKLLQAETMERLKSRAFLIPILERHFSIENNELVWEGNLVDSRCRGDYPMDQPIRENWKLRIGERGGLGRYFYVYTGGRWCAIPNIWLTSGGDVIENDRIKFETELYRPFCQFWEKVSYPDMVITEFNFDRIEQRRIRLMKIIFRAFRRRGHPLDLDLNLDFNWN